MILDIRNTEAVRINGFKGGEGELVAKVFTTDIGKVLYGTLAKGCSIGMHTHEEDCEAVYVLSGTATFTMDGETEIVKSGEAHICPKGHTHCLKNENEEPLVFYAVVPLQ